MILTPSTFLQVLILAIGIYVLLAFLRSTRGSGIVRGLGLMLIVGVYGLWGMADALEWFELKLVIQGLLGFVFVILAILFQPELRRGLVNLGENPLLGRFLQRQRTSVVKEVATAVQTMSRRKQGALIAFEAHVPLDSYVERAAPQDAAVTATLLDTLFHSGSKLHDGAVVIRSDRIISAACIFPLSENPELAPSIGTRHRAALGLTEETDAVTVAVSEETGAISIAKGGSIEKVKREEVLDRLLEKVGKSEESGEAESTPAFQLSGLFTQHLGQKFAALVLAILVFYGAHQDLVFSKDKELRVAAVMSEPGLSRPGELILVHEDGWQVEGAPKTCSVRFEGTRDQLDSMVQVGGIVRLEEDQAEIKINQIEWTPPLDPGVTAYWRDGDDPTLTVVGLEQTEIQLTADMVNVVTADLDPRYEARIDELRFHPAVVRVQGPAGALQGLELRFVDVVLKLDETDVDRTVALSRDLVDQGVELLDQVSVEFPVVRIEESFGVVRRPVTLQQFDKSQGEHEFLPPDTEAVFEVFVRFPGRPTDEDKIRVKSFVSEHLWAFILVDQIPPGTSTGLVTYHDDFSSALAEDDDLRDVELRIELTSDREITLSRRENE